jgi:circadian clock protein KaiC
MADIHTGAAASTGIEGLDEILKGGFPRHEMHVIEGTSGTGKTTLGVQFLLAGRRADEKGLYITLSQSAAALEQTARSHGWSLDGIALYESPSKKPGDRLPPRQTVLRTSEVELDELTRGLFKVISEVAPDRVVFDSLGIIALLAGSASRYRQEIVALRQFLRECPCTAVFLADLAEEGCTGEFHHLAASVITLSQRVPAYGDVRRQLRVVKMRAVPIRGGLHDFRISAQGVEVYPRLDQFAHVEYKDFEQVASGIPALDRMLGGGLERGTTSLLLGPPGSGKSSLGAVYSDGAVRAGHGAAVMLFDERPDTFLRRCDGLKLQTSENVKSGKLHLHEFDKSEVSAGAFGAYLRELIDGSDVRFVMIDSLNGYFNAMGDASMLVPQMHELLAFLSRSGVLTILVAAQESFLSIGARPTVDVSYISDSIIVLRQFEVDGQLRRCIAAIKKRQGEHETWIRELSFGAHGFGVSEEPVRGLRDILSGRPESHGDR